MYSSLIPRPVSFSPNRFSIFLPSTSLRRATISQLFLMISSNQKLISFSRKSTSLRESYLPRPHGFPSASVNGEVQESYNINFDNNEGHYFNETNYIFESPCTNCSNNSSNFIGLTKDDFTNIPNSVKLAFYGLIILGVIFTIFEVIEKWRNLNSDLVILIHSSFAVFSDIISIYITYLCIKFLGSYFLLFYNTPFIEVSGINNIVIIYPVVIILLLISFTIIIIATAVMQTNLHKFEKRLFSEKTSSALNVLSLGRKT